jgi:hypothetical protein
MVTLSLPFTALRALDFTPTFIETEVEAGVKNREIVLKDGPARVLYCPPAGWRAEAGGNWLRFRPLDASMADLTIDADKAPAGRVADATEIPRCRERLKAAVPRDSTDVVLEDDEANPGSVENFPTFGLTVAYSSGGIRYRKRVVFVFTPESELRFTLVARAADFDRLYPSVRQSLFSWRWER